MTAYSVLADYYDKFSQKDCDYKRWSQYLRRVAKRHGVSEIVDIACGTGKMTQLLHNDGFDMIGVDVSTEMLNVAQEKCPTLFVRQDMRSLKLAHPTDMAICVNDGVNYLRPDDVSMFLTRLSAALKNGAPFVFDISSEYKLRNIVGNEVFYWDDADETLLWTNNCGEDRVKMDLALFVREGQMYRRMDETHIQYIHSVPRLESMLDEHGFDLREITVDYGEKLQPDSRRITFYAFKR